MLDFLFDAIFYSLPLKAQFGCLVVGAIVLASLFLYLWMR